jgi:hypothetical protein
MTWNYRVVNCEDETEGDPWVEISEVYYDQLGKPLGYCRATVGGENVGEIQTILTLMTQALDKPVVKFKPSTKKEEHSELVSNIESALESLKAACGIAPKYKILDDGVVYFYMDEK